MCSCCEIHGFYMIWNIAPFAPVILQMGSHVLASLIMMIFPMTHWQVVVQLTDVTGRFSSMKITWWEVMREAHRSKMRLSWKTKRLCHWLWQKRLLKCKQLHHTEPSNVVNHQSAPVPQQLHLPQRSRGNGASSTLLFEQMRMVNGHS